MTTRNLFTIAAIVAAIFGLGFALMPGQMTALYNVQLDEAGRFVGQLFGAALLGFAVLNWTARGLKDAQGLQVVITANLVGDGIGFVVALIGQLGGVAGVNALGWSTVALYLLLAAGFAYFRFRG